MRAWGVWLRGHRLLVHLSLAALTLLSTVWLSSGTMAIYGTSCPWHNVEPPCGYVHSIDHAVFEKIFLMLQGLPRERWQDSNSLRRFLFTAFAYPWMRWLGFEVGGFLAGLILALTAFVVTARVVARRFGDEAAIATGWLLSTYPGFAYWGALPYTYISIIPCSLLCFWLLWQLSEAASLRTAAGLSLAIGALASAYDGVAFAMLPAALLVLAFQRRWGWLLPSGGLLALPGALCVVAVTKIAHLSLSNDNTDSYKHLVESLFAAPDFALWAQLLGKLPEFLVRIFFYSNFWFLPALFAVLLIFNYKHRYVKLTVPEVAVLLSVLALFVLINGGPPYGDPKDIALVLNNHPPVGRPWQMRGPWLSRLFQPVFVVYLSFGARLLASSVGPVRSQVRLAYSASILLNASIAFGPILHNDSAGTVYCSFYQHWCDDQTMGKTLSEVGRRPLGFCKH